MVYYSNDTRNSERNNVGTIVIKIVSSTVFPNKTFFLLYFYLINTLNLVLHELYLQISQKVVEERYTRRDELPRQDYLNDLYRIIESYVVIRYHECVLLKKLSIICPVY